jgi:hypothetical protein
VHRSGQRKCSSRGHNPARDLDTRITRRVGLTVIGAAAESSKTAKQTARDLFGQGHGQGAGCSLRLFIDLPGVDNYPIQGLIFGRKAVDAPLVSCVISYHHVPTRSVLVLEGQHHGVFFRGFRV